MIFVWTIFVFVVSFFVYCFFGGVTVFTLMLRRGPAADWCEVVCVHLRHSRAVRLWFATEVLFGHSHRLAEYLLECPNAEVRPASFHFRISQSVLPHFSSFFSFFLGCITGVVYISDVFL